MPARAPARSRRAGRCARDAPGGRRSPAFVVAKLDRLTRSVRDLGELLASHFAERSGVDLVSVAESIDTRSAAGRLVLNVLGMSRSGSAKRWRADARSDACEAVERRPLRVPRRLSARGAPRAQAGVTLTLRRSGPRLSPYQPARATQKARRIHRGHDAPSRSAVHCDAHFDAHPPAPAAEERRLPAVVRQSSCLGVTAHAGCGTIAHAG
ncbi:recombinase family protein [Sandaracinus amylolyticus]|uniref:recombinase family protein n=1 Tax=Sandaracinus TaxID=1055688 RepID=UPI003AF34A0D